MTVLSLFDGMSCGQIALRELGIKVDKYFASEIDKHAIAQTQLNFPNTIHIGDVTKVDVNKLEYIDLLIGGSPCQSFSFVGKRNGMSTTENEEVYSLDRYLELKNEGFEFEGQSYLFWEYMRILIDIMEYNPNMKFLLENVEMGAKWERVISEAIGIYGVHINSTLVSAQNRKRIYWTNIKTRKEGLFHELHSDIPQPEDRGILLRDILERDVDEKYYLSEKTIESLTSWGERNAKNGNGFKPQIKSADEKSAALTTGSMKSNSTYIKIDRNGNIEHNHKKASYSTAGAHSYQHNRVYDVNDITVMRKEISQLEPRNDGKTNTLTTVQKDNLIFEPKILQHPRGFNKGGSFSDKTPTLSSHSWEQNNVLLNNTRIRRLTPTECSRLQTIPKWYRWECSDTQQYKMLGNGWTVEVIKHLFSFLRR